MRMLYWPRRSPFNVSKKLPRKAAKSLIDVAAPSPSSLICALRPKPENALTPFAFREILRPRCPGN